MAQNTLSFGIGGGITLSKMVNAAERQKGFSYDVNAIIDKNIYATLTYFPANKFGIYAEAGFITTGFEERKVQGFVEGTTFPIHYFNKHKYDYFETGVGGLFKIQENTLILLGIKSMFFQKDYYEYGFFERKVYVLDGESSGYSNFYEFETDDFEELDIAIEFGLTHFVWKGLFVRATYLRGFLQANNKMYNEIKFFNQALTFTMGYDFGIIKQK